MKIKEILFSISIVLFLSINLAFAQDDDNKPKKVRLKLEYLKTTDGTLVLSSNLYWKEGKVFNSVVDEDVIFGAESDTAEIELGVVKSDKDGNAVLHIEKGFKFPINEEGFTTFTAKMNKSDKFKRASRSVDVKDAELTFTLEEVDSIKTVSLNLTTLNSENEVIPVVEGEVYVYVKRLLSLYKIENGETDEEGNFEVEFPNDMPGDSVGNLTIIVKLLESDDYATIEQVKEIKWGTVVSYDEAKQPRSLWTGEAPLWMIIGVSVILLGAWFNFGLAIYKVAKIKNANKETV